MTRTTLSLPVEDVSAFARALARELGDATPGHLRLMHALARAAGFENVQHLRARQAAARRLAQPVPAIDARLVERTLTRFDGASRLTAWPAKRAVQTLALWALWARLPRGEMTEREVSRALDKLHTFEDAATLRRVMIGAAMLARTPDGGVYRLTGTPPPELAVLMARLRR
ncbi:MAG: DUF2087 domain-containing protein [Pseudomonadota bacterium]